MTSRMQKIFSHASRLSVIARYRRFFFSLVVLLPGLAVAPAILAADPDIAVQPVGGIAATGESFGFEVGATGTAPFFYQWQLNGSSLQNQTNSWITITNLAVNNSGNYSVIVTNSLGSIVSSNAFLTVTNVGPRTLFNGAVTGGSQVTVPLLLSANGREHRVTFTLGYDPGILTNPTFVPSVTNDSASLNTSMTNAGLVIGDLTLPAGQTFPAGYSSEFGQLHFDFLTGSNPLLAGLYFTNVDLSATNLTFDTNGLEMQVSGFILPQSSILSASPALNRQSGLFEQQLTVSYAGAIPMTNVTLLVSGAGNTSQTDVLGYDSLTNAITVYNSPGTIFTGPDADGLFIQTPYVSAGNFQTGDSRVLTIEFYVSDHTTVPNPVYSLSAAATFPFFVPSAATPLNITTNRFVDGTFIIQWPSRVNYEYFVQYAPTLTDLMNNTTNANVAVPPVPGTGFSLQWIDNGPPKTVSPPVAGSRFYRVLELPTQ